MAFVANPFIEENWNEIFRTSASTDFFSRQYWIASIRFEGFGAFNSRAGLKRMLIYNCVSLAFSVWHYTAHHLNGNCKNLSQRIWSKFASTSSRWETVSKLHFLRSLAKIFHWNCKFRYLWRQPAEKGNFSVNMFIARQLQSASGVGTGQGRPSEHYAIFTFCVCSPRALSLNWRLKCLQFVHRSFLPRWFNYINAGWKKRHNGTPRHFNSLLFPVAFRINWFLSLAQIASIASWIASSFSRFHLAKPDTRSLAWLLRFTGHLMELICFVRQFIYILAWLGRAAGEFEAKVNSARHRWWQEIKEKSSTCDEACLMTELSVNAMTW